MRVRQYKKGQGRHRSLPVLVSLGYIVGRYFDGLIEGRGLRLLGWGVLCLLQRVHGIGGVTNTGSVYNEFHADHRAYRGQEKAHDPI